MTMILLSGLGKTMVETGCGDLRLHLLNLTEILSQA
jgi:hypothetical protein